MATAEPLRTSFAIWPASSGSATTVDPVDWTLTRQLRATTVTALATTPPTPAVPTSFRLVLGLHSGALVIGTVHYGESHRSDGGLQFRPTCQASAHTAPIAILQVLQYPADAPEGFVWAVLSITRRGEARLTALDDGRCLRRHPNVYPGSGGVPQTLCVTTAQVTLDRPTLGFLAGTSPTVAVLDLLTLDVITVWPQADWVVGLACHHRMDTSGGAHPSRLWAVTCTVDGTLQTWDIDLHVLLADHALWYSWLQGTEPVAPPVDSPRRHDPFRLTGRYTQLGDRVRHLTLHARDPSKLRFAVVFRKGAKLFRLEDNVLTESVRWSVPVGDRSDLRAAAFVNGGTRLCLWDQLGNALFVDTASPPTPLRFLQTQGFGHRPSPATACVTASATGNPQDSCDFYVAWVNAPVQPGLRLFNTRHPTPSAPSPPHASTPLPGTGALLSPSPALSVRDEGSPAFGSARKSPAPPALSTAQFQPRETASPTVRPRPPALGSAASLPGRRADLTPMMATSPAPGSGERAPVSPGLALAFRDLLGPGSDHTAGSRRSSSVAASPILRPMSAESDEVTGLTSASLRTETGGQSHMAPPPIHVDPAVTIQGGDRVVPSGTWVVPALRPRLDLKGTTSAVTWSTVGSAVDERGPRILLGDAMTGDVLDVAADGLLTVDTETDNSDGDCTQRYHYATPGDTPGPCTAPPTCILALTSAHSKVEDTDPHVVVGDLGGQLSIWHSTVSPPLRCAVGTGPVTWLLPLDSRTARTSPSEHPAPADLVDRIRHLAVDLAALAPSAPAFAHLRSRSLRSATAAVASNTSTRRFPSAFPSRPRRRSLTGTRKSARLRLPTPRLGLGVPAGPRSPHDHHHHPRGNRPRVNTNPAASLTTTIEPNDAGLARLRIRLAAVDPADLTHPAFPTLLRHAAVLHHLTTSYIVVATADRSLALVDLANHRVLAATPPTPHTMGTVRYHPATNTLRVMWDRESVAAHTWSLPKPFVDPMPLLAPPNPADGGPSEVVFGFPPAYTAAVDPAVAVTPGLTLPSGRVLYHLVTLDARASITALRSPTSSETDSASLLAAPSGAAARLLLRAVLPWSLDPTLDDHARRVLHIVPPARSYLPAAIDAFDGSAVIHHTPSSVSTTTVAPWTVSGHTTAGRLLTLLATLYAVLGAPDRERELLPYITFLGGLLPDAVGPRFCLPNLARLAAFWQDRDNGLQQTARMLLGTTLQRLDSAAITAFTEFWAMFVPGPTSPANTSNGAHPGPSHRPRSIHPATTAVLLLGAVGADERDALPDDLRRRVAEALLWILRSPNARPPARAVATEVVSRGFTTWSPYLDGTQLVRTLVLPRACTTASDADELQARSALLRVTALAPALVASALNLDLLVTGNLQDRRAALRVLGYLAPRRAAALAPFLARLVDTVVQSLDPRVPEVRKGMVGAVTQCLQELVRTYPSLAFHSATQKLALGTPEGAVVVLDLRTATHCLVLEGHRLPVVAVGFSPDGRHIGSYCAGENRLVVWEATTNLFSMLASSFFATMKTRGRARTHDLDTHPHSSSPGTSAGEGAGRLSSSSLATSMETTESRSNGTVSATRPSREFRTIPAKELLPTGQGNVLADGEFIKHTRLDWPSDHTIRLSLWGHVFNFST